MKGLLLTAIAVIAVTGALVVANGLVTALENTQRLPVAAPLELLDEVASDCAVMRVDFEDRKATSVTVDVDCLRETYPSAVVELKGTTLQF